MSLENCKDNKNCPHQVGPACSELAVTHVLEEVAAGAEGERGEVVGLNEECGRHSPFQNCDSVLDGLAVIADGWENSCFLVAANST